MVSERKKQLVAGGEQHFYNGFILNGCTKRPGVFQRVIKAIFNELITFRLIKINIIKPFSCFGFICGKLNENW